MSPLKMADLELDIMTRKCRAVLRRESALMNIITMFSKKIDESADMEEARFWSGQMVQSACDIDDKEFTEEETEAMEEADN